MDLSLVLLDEIWEELKKRYDGCILTTLKNRGDGTEEIQINYYGGKFTCIGLAEKTKDRILQSTREGDNA